MNDDEVSMILPRDFPKELSRFALSLIPHGTIEVVWRHEHAIAAIEWFTERGYAISGGDVLTQKGEEFAYTYDSWYVNQGALEWDTYVEKSILKAIDYITKYHLRNGDGYYYAFQATPKNWRELIELAKKSR